MLKYRHVRLKVRRKWRLLKGESCLNIQQTAIDAAKQAGELIRERAGNIASVETKSSLFDLVTDVDKRAEGIIRRVVSEVYPDHCIFGEESSDGDVGDVSSSHEYVWIVDPLDGTTNFVHGVPFYCVSIGVVHKKELVAGGIYDPMSDELFTAAKSEGAYLNGRLMRVSGEKRIAESLLASDFPANEYRQATVNGMLKLSPLCRNIRTAGSTALELAYVAAGRFSGYWELGLKPWDLAAGVLLVQEAGGRVSDTLGNPYTIETSHVVATNGLIHEELIGHLAEANATG